MKKTEQLQIDFNKEEPVNKVYYNGLGDPLPWEEEQARLEGWKPKEVS